MATVNSPVGSTGLGAKELHLIEAVDEGLVAVPYSYSTLAGQSAQTLLYGDMIQTITRTSAGLYNIALKRNSPVCAGASPPVVDTTSNVLDLYAQIDTSPLVQTGPTASNFNVKLKTGTANTDPADGTIIRGVMYFKKYKRSGRFKP